MSPPYPINEDSSVTVTQISTDSPLTPGMLVLVVILSVVGLIFIILLLWYSQDCMGRHKKKVEEDEENLEKSIEVLREVGVIDLKESSLMTQGNFVPRINPGFSPSVFKGGIEEIDNLETGTVKVTIHALDEGKFDSGKRFLTVPGEMGISNKSLTVSDENSLLSNGKNCLMVPKENTMRISNSSINTVFLDCREDSPLPSYIQLRGSPAVSFKSAINSFRPRKSRTHSVTSTTTLSCNKPDPICKMQFPQAVIASNKEPLCQEDTPSSSTSYLDQTMRFETEF